MHVCLYASFVLYYNVSKALTYLQLYVQAAMCMYTQTIRSEFCTNEDSDAMPAHFLDSVTTADHTAAATATTATTTTSSRSRGSSNLTLT